MFRLAGVALISLLLSSPASAQGVITVNAGGLPVAGAEVTIWGASELLLAARTDESGRASIPSAVGRRAPLDVLVRRLGFVSARANWNGVDSLALHMVAVPASLPVLALVAKALSCPANSEPEAEQLWATSAARYAHGATHLVFQWVGGLIQESVTAEQRGYGDGEEFRYVTHGAILPDTTLRGRSLLRDPPPYAVFEQQFGMTGANWRWRYAPLQDVAAEHFVSARFRERHALVVLGRSVDATIVGFCPRSEEGPEIAGELQIGADSSLRAARWFMHVPHDDEGAGGEATFGETVFEGARYLVAMRGSTWRRASRERFNQDRFEFRHWRFGHSVAESMVQ